MEAVHKALSLAAAQAPNPVIDLVGEQLAHSPAAEVAKPKRIPDPAAKVTAEPQEPAPAAKAASENAQPKGVLDVSDELSREEQIAIRKKIANGGGHVSNVAVSSEARAGSALAKEAGHLPGKLAIAGTIAAVIGLSWMVSRKKTANERHQNLESTSGKRLKEDMGLPYKTHSTADASLASVWGTVTGRDPKAEEARRNGWVQRDGKWKKKRPGIFGRFDDFLEGNKRTFVKNIPMPSDRLPPEVEFNLMMKKVGSVIRDMAGATMRKTKDAPDTTEVVKQDAKIKPAKFTASVVNNDIPIIDTSTIYQRHARGFAY